MTLNDIPQNELELAGMLHSIYGMTNDNSKQKGILKIIIVIKAIKRKLKNQADL